MKEVSYDERTHYERTQKIYPFKKRKFFNQEFSTSDRGFNQDGAFISSDKRTNGKHCTAGAKMHVPFPLYFLTYGFYLGIC